MAGEGAAGATPGDRSWSGTGLDGLLGLEVDEVGPTRVTARLRIDERHLQPMGLVHGGVYAAVAESLASIGAFVNARQSRPQAQAVGLENHTTFLRAARAGTVVAAAATVRHGGRRTQSWAVSLRDAESGEELAVSNVRLIVVDPGTV